jgi:hypothetical protein
MGQMRGKNKRGLTTSRPWIQSRLQHRFIPSDRWVLLHMRIHLDIMLEREEAFQRFKNLVECFLRNTVVLDIEETTFLTRFSDLCCDGFALRRGAAKVAYVYRGNRGKACRLLGYFAIGGFGAGVKVYILA